tara:strand:+ start:677 stop:1237 length:561 start_codon:yes stop_codon:yes gene_type:complete
MHNPYIVGKKIYFRHPIKEDLNGKWHEWFSDEETTKYLESRFWPNSIESQKIFYDSLHNDRNKLVLSIVLKSNDKHIGVISLASINWVHRYADLGIVIGEKNYNKSIYAVESFALMLRIAFLKLNLDNVRAAFCDANKHSEALMKLFRFKVIGKYKELIVVDGKKEDLICTYIDKISWLEKNGLSN